MDTNLSPKFWSDPAVEELDPGAKLAFLWLMTNSNRDVAGFTQFSLRRFVFETGLDSEALQRAMEGLGKGLVDFGKGLIWVRNFVAYQFGRNDRLARNNIAKTVVKRVEERPESIREVFYSEYPELRLKETKNTTPPQGLDNPLPRGTGTGTGTGTGKEQDSGMSVAEAEASTAYPKSGDMDEAKRRIDSLSPSFKITPQWSVTENRALHESGIAGAIIATGEADLEMARRFLAADPERDGRNNRFFRPTSRKLACEHFSTIMQQADKWARITGYKKRQAPKKSPTPSYTNTNEKPISDEELEEIRKEFQASVR